jgi:hypothetical protein
MLNEFLSMNYIKNFDSWNILESEGRVDEALEFLKKISDYFKNLKGDYKKGVDAATEALEKDTKIGGKSIRVILKDRFSKLDQKSLESAKNFLQKLKKNPEDLENKVKALNEKKSFDEIMDSISKWTGIAFLSAGWIVSIITFIKGAMDASTGNPGLLILGIAGVLISFGISSATNSSSDRY